MRSEYYRDFKLLRLGWSFSKISSLIKESCHVRCLSLTSEPRSQQLNDKSKDQKKPKIIICAASFISSSSGTIKGLKFVING